MYDDQDFRDMQIRLSNSQAEITRLEEELRQGHLLSKDEVRTLEAAKEANPWWFRLVSTMAHVIGQRRAKWSGDNPDPFVNFQVMADIMGQPIDEAFKWMIALKLSRQSDQDFADDSRLDNKIDEMNYRLLQVAYRLYLEDQKHDIPTA